MPSGWIGPGALGALAGEVRAGQRVLLVSDPGLVAAGHVGRAAGLLRGAGASVELWTEVSPNPLASAVAAAARAASAADLVVGLGGGSAMDTAKGAALLARQPVDPQALHGRDGVGDDVLPFVLVPTTAGTGTEAQSFLLWSRDADHAKVAVGHRRLMARAVIVDPELLVTCPASVMVEAGLDATVHALEAAVSTATSPAGRGLAVEAFATLWALLPRRLAGAAVDEALAEAAFLAGAAIEAGMLGACHATANPLTAVLGAPHGLAVASMAAAVIRYNVGVADYGPILAAVGLPDASALSVAWTAHLRELGAPTGPQAFGEVDVDRCASLAAEQWTGRFNPRPVDQAALAGIYRDALRDGEPG